MFDLQKNRVLNNYFFLKLAFFYDFKYKYDNFISIDQTIENSLNLFILVDIFNFLEIHNKKFYNEIFFKIIFYNSSLKYNIYNILFDFKNDFFKYKRQVVRLKTLLLDKIEDLNFTDDLSLKNQIILLNKNSKDISKFISVIRNYKYLNENMRFRFYRFKKYICKYQYPLFVFDLIHDLVVNNKFKSSQVDNFIHKYEIYLEKKKAVTYKKILLRIFIKYKLRYNFDFKYFTSINEYLSNKKKIYSELKSYFIYKKKDEINITVLYLSNVIEKYINNCEENFLNVFKNYLINKNNTLQEICLKNIFKSKEIKEFYTKELYLLIKRNHIFNDKNIKFAKKFFFNLNFAVICLKDHLEKLLKKVNDKILFKKLKDLHEKTTILMKYHKIIEMLTKL